MRKLVTLFVFVVITGMTAACEESPLGVPEIASPPPASFIDCDEWPEGIPDPNSFCDDGEG